MVGHAESLGRLESQARFAFAARLVEDKRVLLVGDVDATGLMALADALPASLSVVCKDPETHAQSLGGQGLDGLVLYADEGLPIELDEETYDVVVCFDFAERLAVDEEWLFEIRRLVADDGLLIVAVANSGGEFLTQLVGAHGRSSLGCTSLIEKLNEVFPVVRCIGQAPLVGSLFFHFDGDDDDEPTVSLDRTLLTDDNETPGWFLLLAGAQNLDASELAVVQLPFAQVVDENKTRFDAASRVVKLPQLRSPAAQQLEHAERVIKNLEASLRESARREAQAVAHCRLLEKDLSEQSHLRLLAKDVDPAATPAADSGVDLATPIASS